MSKITNDGLTRSDTGCFIVVAYPYGNSGRQRAKRAGVTSLAELSPRRERSAVRTASLLGFSQLFTTHMRRSTGKAPRLPARPEPEKHYLRRFDSS